MEEKLIRRVLYISKCPVCGDSQERADHPPRERLCNQCKVWVPFVEQEWIGKPTIGDDK